MIDFEIPEHVRIMRDTIRRFVREELIPLEAGYGYDDENMPAAKRKELIEKLQGLGMYDLQVPVQEGGAGFGLRDVIVVHEELSRSMIGKDFWKAAMVPAELYSVPEDVRSKYLERAKTGELRTCFCLTEPNAGSDPSAMETHFVREGDNYIINGRKVFITGAHVAHYARVFAREKGTRGRSGIAVFLVDTSTAGFRVERVIPTLGRPSSVTTDCCEVSLDDCVVPASHRFGSKTGEDWTTAQEVLGGARLRMGARSIALAGRCLDLATDHAKQRVTFGEPLASRQGVQFMLSDSLMEIQATRMMTYYGAWKIDRNLDARQEISMVKVLASEMLWRVADRTIQIFGGTGVSRDLPIEKIYRDARIDRIVDGPNEVHRWVIARGLLKHGIVL